MMNVAAYAGVSIATVSKVMQGKPTVLPENVTKVQNAIEALGYRINPLGAELRRGRRNLIGLVVPTLKNSVMGELIMELELAVERRGHVLFVASSHSSETRETDIILRMIDWRVAGVVVKSVSRQSRSATMLLADAAMPSAFLPDLPAKARSGKGVAAGESNANQLAADTIDTLFINIDKSNEIPAFKLSK